MGAVHPEFESAILETVRKHAPDTKAATGVRETLETKRAWLAQISSSME